ncbi:unnamed protein product [Heligmosomoides polygyrus]|uniref:BTB domain-containing protein n=1 Tax=Heligmosomoides polygyrus TaxID=6339 RepID=A0A183G1Q2_HELPZ|nr:unnamed protein product [Heligmosomoides polygyrus]
METKMLRWTAGVTRMDRIRNDVIRQKFGVAPIADKMREANLRWYGHVLRGREDSVRKIGLNFKRQRVVTCQNSLNRSRTTAFLSTIAAQDEKWCTSDNTTWAIQWLPKHAGPERIPKPSHVTITADLFTKDMLEMKRKLLEKYPGFDSTWHHIDHSASVVGKMDGLFSGALLPDMTFLVEGERVQAHRIILGSRCKYFKDLLSNEQEENVEKEFPISFTTLSAFRATVRYRTKPVLGTSSNGALHNAKLDIDNVFSVLPASTSLGLDDIEERCILFACEHGSEVLASEEFVKLPLEMVVKMLSRDSFNACFELETKIVTISLSG